MYKKGDRVRIIKIMGDMVLRPELHLGKEYEIESTGMKGNVLIPYSNRFGMWVPFESIELVGDEVPYGRIIRKIADIKERRVRLGYQY